MQDWSGIGHARGQSKRGCAAAQRVATHMARALLHIPQMTTLCHAPSPSRPPPPGPQPGLATGVMPRAAAPELPPSSAATSGPSSRTLQGCCRPRPALRHAPAPAAASASASASACRSSSWLRRARMCCGRDSLSSTCGTKHNIRTAVSRITCCTPFDPLKANVHGHAHMCIRTHARFPHIN